jgi:hypothetical protein
MAEGQLVSVFMVHAASVSRSANYEICQDHINPQNVMDCE